MLPELTGYFEANGCGTLGTDMFMGAMPDAPVDCAGLYEAPGPAPVVDSSGVTLEKPRLLIFVRGSSYSEARRRAERFYRACLSIKNMVLTTAVYNAAVPDAPPYLSDRDAHRRPIFALDVTLWKQLTPLA